MIRTRRTKRHGQRADRRGSRTSLSRWHRRGLVPLAGKTLLVVAAMTAGSVALARLETQVERRMAEQYTPTVDFVDLPVQLAALAGNELRERLSSTVAEKWTDDRRCREMVESLTAVGWVAQVNHVRRKADARFEISCEYRMPYAMVQHDDRFLLVGLEGVRLPGIYLYDPAWKLIQGVASPPPQPGALWEGNDLQAALALVQAVEGEPFSSQMTAVLVENFNGRVDPRSSHIEIATDRAGGRIRWGSAPGFEVEENTVKQKLAILRQNIRQTGRVDAGYSIIDISTFSDRFTVPK